MSRIFFIIVLAAMFFAVSLILTNFIKPEVTAVRLPSGLDCANVSISDGTKATCLGIDLIVPLLIIIAVGTTIGLIVRAVP